MSRIYRVPRGLQSFLDSQNFGKNPDELSRVVAPTLDMEPFYAVEGLQWGKSNTINRTADSNISVTIVPAGEVYFLRSVGVVLDNNPAVAGEGGHYSVHLTNIPTSNQPLTQHPIAYLGSFFGGSTTALSLSVEFPKLIPISANSSIWFMLDGSNFTGAGNVNIKTCYSYYREFA